MVAILISVALLAAAAALVVAAVKRLEAASVTVQNLPVAPLREMSDVLNQVVDEANWLNDDRVHCDGI